MRKSITSFSVLRLLQKPGKICGRQILYHKLEDDGNEEVIDLTNLNPNSYTMRSIREARSG